MRWYSAAFFVSCAIRTVCSDEVYEDDLTAIGATSFQEPIMTCSLNADCTCVFSNEAAVETVTPITPEIDELEDVCAPVDSTSSLLSSCPDVIQGEVYQWNVTHTVFRFPHRVIQRGFLLDSKTALVRLGDDTVFKSVDEGRTWVQLVPENGKQIISLHKHQYSSDRAYIMTNTTRFYYTTDAGTTWHRGKAPLPPSPTSYIYTPALGFHPTRPDILIWIGIDGYCPMAHRHSTVTCYTTAYMSTDHGQNWHKLVDYVIGCVAVNLKHPESSESVLCESHKSQRGDQTELSHYDFDRNPGFQISLVSRQSSHDMPVTSWRPLLEDSFGLGIEPRLVVREYHRESGDTCKMTLLVSQDNSVNNFMPAIFPPNICMTPPTVGVDAHKSKSTFLHSITRGKPPLMSGPLLKSDTTGTQFVVSLDNVVRQTEIAEHETLFEGVAVANVIVNAEDMIESSSTALDWNWNDIARQTRITYNDGGSWHRLPAPIADSLGEKYDCNNANCSLHLHITHPLHPDRLFRRHTTLAVPGLSVAVGNVGDRLAPYEQGNMFISRHVGAPWEETLKGTYHWAFGASGAILVMVQDTAPTDHIMFSTDEGLHWEVYKFTKGDVKIHVDEIITARPETSSKFLLLGRYDPLNDATLAIHLDFSKLLDRQCIFNRGKPTKDDVGVWVAGPDQEVCILGRRPLYFRRQRVTDCVLGDDVHVTNISQEHVCACTAEDFECEFNHVRHANGSCVPIDGAELLPNNDTCDLQQEIWFERTAYRRIASTRCRAGLHLDHGAPHKCPGYKIPQNPIWEAMWELFSSVMFR